jgi:hypothetical protein
MMEEPQKDYSNQAIASLIVGVACVFAWCIPCFGVPISIVGIVFGIMGLKSAKRSFAIAGLVLSILFLVFAVVNAGIGAYMGVKGDNPFVNLFK